jgi:uncharacterized protein YkwD
VADAGQRYRLVALQAPPGATNDDLALSGERITVGSAPDNDLRIPDPSVSRLHAILERTPDGYRLSDRGSTNGTYVNGRRITVAVAVRDGDEVRFGGRGYRLVRLAHRPIAARGRRTGVKAASAIAAFAAIALAAFVGVRRMLPRDTEGQQVGAGRGAEASLPAPTADLAEVPAPLAEAPKPMGPTGESLPPSPRPAVPVEAMAAAQPWLTPLNYYRQLAELAPVTPDPALAAGDLAHARYLVKTDTDNIRAGTIGAEAHTEDPSNPWYSRAGQVAAQGSDVEAGANPYGKPWITPQAAISGWISTPFHRLAILNPLLQAAGYGQYCDGGSCAAALNLLTDMDPVPPIPEMLPKPIMFPPDGSTLPLRSWEGEWPDPLTSCPGYSAPSGLGITLQLGLTLETNLSQYQVTRGRGAPVAIEVCGFDSDSYVNPDPSTQERGRHILVNLGALVIVPRAPLEAGDYNVAMTANDHPYAWSFTISP